MGYLYSLDLDGTPGDVWEVTDKPLVVGRGSSAEVVLPDASLSRSHFMLIQEHGLDFLVDLESQNGTSVNGERVTGRKLEHGALIQAGKSLFYYSLHRLPAHFPPISLAVAASACHQPPAASSSSLATAILSRHPIPGP